MIDSLDHELVLPIWKSNVSLTLMIDKKAKRFIALIISMPKQADSVNLIAHSACAYSEWMLQERKTQSVLRIQLWTESILVHL